jgi:hypothetical protein
VGEISHFAHHLISHLDGFGLPMFRSSAAKKYYCNKYPQHFLEDVTKYAK